MDCHAALLVYARFIAIPTLLIGTPSTLGATQDSGLVVLTGVVRGSVTRKPVSGALVLVEGTSRAGATTEDGRFTIRHVPRGTLSLLTRAIGYRPIRASFVASSDSTEVQLEVGEPRPRSPVSDSFPSFGIDERHEIWAALLRGLGAVADNVVAHLQEVGARVPGSPITAPTGPTHVVLFLRPTSDPALADTAWHRQLIRGGIIEGVCRTRSATDCPQRGFRLFVTPATPARFAADSVTVAIDFTAIDAVGCRRGRGAGDSGNEWHLVTRHLNGWGYVGPDETEGRSIGGMYCGFGN